MTDKIIIPKSGYIPKQENMIKLVNKATNFDKKTKKNIIKDTPLKRLGTPQDIANTVFYLLSEQSKFTTGQTLVTDGGKITLP